MWKNFALMTSLHFPARAGCVRIYREIRVMDEMGRNFAPELAPAESRKWIGRLLMAVLMGIAIWHFLVAITENLFLPAMARLLEADPQSPLYLGKGTISAPALFTATVELCCAGIVAAVIHARMQRPARRVRVVARSAAAPRPTTVVPAAPVTPTAPVSAPVVVPRAQAPTPAPEAPPPPLQAPVPVVASSSTSGVSSQAAAATPPAPPKQPQLEKHAKPKKPKEVYYNLVGEPIDADDE